MLGSCPWPRRPSPRAPTDDNDRDDAENNNEKREENVGPASECHSDPISLIHDHVEANCNEGVMVGVTCVAGRQFKKMVTPAQSKFD